MSQYISIGVSDAFDRTIPPVENLAELLGEFVITGCGDVFGYGLGGSSDVAGYAGHGIGIATKGDGTDGGIHETVGFEEADDGFRDSLFAGCLESI